MLEDVVRVVRRERPDVLIARFQGAPRDGHGHHQLSGVLTRRAFQAAADPHRFPEQIAEGLKPWQPRKLYANNINPRWRPEDKDAWTIPLPTGEFNPLLGRSYSQIARNGLGYQRSQGILGHEGPSGPSTSYYRLVQTTLPEYSPKTEQSFFDGLDTTITGLGGASGEQWLSDGLKSVETSIGQASKAFDPQKPETAAEPLAAGLRETRRIVTRLKDRSSRDQQLDRVLEVLERKAAQFEEALARSLALDLQATAERPVSSGSESAGEPSQSGQTMSSPEKMSLPSCVSSTAATFLWKFNRLDFGLRSGKAGIGSQSCSLGL